MSCVHALLGLGSRPGGGCTGVLLFLSPAEGLREGSECVLGGLSFLCCLLSATSKPLEVTALDSCLVRPLECVGRKLVLFLVAVGCFVSVAKPTGDENFSRVRTGTYYGAMVRALILLVFILWLKWSHLAEMLTFAGVLQKQCCTT